MHQQGLVPSASVAILYGALGESSEAFAWLERLTRRGTLNLSISKPVEDSSHCVMIRDLDNSYAVSGYPIKAPTKNVAPGRSSMSSAISSITQMRRKIGYRPASETQSLANPAPKVEFELLQMMPQPLPPENIETLKL